MDMRYFRLVFGFSGLSPGFLVEKWSNSAKSGKIRACIFEKQAFSPKKQPCFLKIQDGVFAKQDRPERGRGCFFRDQDRPNFFNVVFLGNDPVRSPRNLAFF